MKNNQLLLLAGGAVLLLLLGSKKDAKAATSTGTGTSGGTIYPNASATGKTPRGIRNNNVGNIIISSANWVGKIPKDLNTDGTFEQFTEKKFGTRAMIKLLKNYIIGGTNSINAIIKKYEAGAPAYIKFVSDRTGFGEFQLLSGDKTTLKKLVQSMAVFENGVENVVSDYEFEEAFAIL